MTVKDMIEELQKLPPEMPVIIKDLNDQHYPVLSVEASNPRELGGVFAVILARPWRG